MRFYSRFVVSAIGVASVSRGCAAAEKPAPLDRAPYLQNVTPRDATVLWQTKAATRTEISWGLPGARAAHTATADHATNAHSFRLTGLQPNTVYRYQIAGNAGGTFTTAPAPNSSARFRFAAWGDSGSGEAGQLNLVPQLEKFKPQFLVHTGDLIYPRGAWSDYDPKFFRVYAPLLRDAPFYGCIGNHDNLTQRAAPWLANFDLPRNGPRGITPERNYSFVWGNAQFWVLDGNTTGAQMKTNRGVAACGHWQK